MQVFRHYPTQSGQGQRGCKARWFCLKSSENHEARWFCLNSSENQTKKHSSLQSTTNAKCILLLGGHMCHTPSNGLQILPLTIAITHYAIGLKKLSANRQFFASAQTAVSLLQTSQVMSAISFTITHVAYTSIYKIKIIWIKMELFFDSGLPCLMFTCVFGHMLLPQS